MSVLCYMVMVNGYSFRDGSNDCESGDSDPLTAYHVEIIAIDAAGNTSFNNPTGEFTTIDTTPQFAVGATLVPHDASPRRVRASGKLPSIMLPLRAMRF